MRKIKSLVRYLLLYSLLIAFILGLRMLHHLEINWHYYMVITISIFSFITIFSFLEPKHIERILPKNSKALILLTLMLRFVPLAGQKVNNIKSNQQMRGAKFGRLGQVKNYASLLIPAIVVAMKWSDNVAEGIKMRGGD